MKSKVEKEKVTDESQFLPVPWSDEHSVGSIANVLIELARQMGFDIIRVSDNGRFWFEVKPNNAVTYMKVKKK